MQSEDEDAVIYEELGPPPPPPTEASNENLYSEPKVDHTVDSFANLLDRSEWAGQTVAFREKFELYNNPGIMT